MNWQKECKLKPGVNPVLKAGEMDLSFLRLDILVFASGESYQGVLPENEEAVLNVLSGRCFLETSGCSVDFGLRQDVFSAPARGAYLSPGSRFTLQAKTAVEVALFKAPGVGQAVIPSYVVKPGELKAQARGDAFFRRLVTDLVGMDRPAGRLIVGETINEAGNWSSYPPHKHDRENLPEESRLEEAYFFRFQPENGFGLMRIYTADKSVDQPLLLRHNNLVSIPRGYHPVAAPPGYRLYYLWALAGPKRVMKVAEDRDYAWVGKKQA